MTPLEELHRFGLKILIHPGTEPSPADCIPIFHRWIQQKSLDGPLIDVADYAHLIDGPRLLLVGHEGNLSLHGGEGRVGLLYSSKRLPAGSFSDRLREVARRLLTAASLLSEEDGLGRKPRFASGSLEFMANDRLVVPLDEHSATQLRPALSGLMSALYPEGTHEISTLGGGEERFRLLLASREEPSLRDLLNRISQPA